LKEGAMRLQSDYKTNSNGRRKAKRLVRSVSLAHVATGLNKSQLAVVAAISRQSTQRKLAKAFGISAPMISVANGLTPQERQHVLTGRVRLGHYYDAA
jgi:hypothetical protein